MCRISTVVQNTGCGFACVCRTDMRQRAFESPDLGQCFEYPHHMCQVPRKFSTGPRRSVSWYYLVGRSKSRKGASTLRFCAFSVDEDKVRGYLRDLERICQTKVAMNLSRLLKTIDARGTVQGITKKQEKWLAKSVQSFVDVVSCTRNQNVQTFLHSLRGTKWQQKLGSVAFISG